MESFNFKARRRTGEIVVGIINAANEAAVASYVRNQGLLVTNITKTNKQKKYFWSSWLEPQITQYDVAIFCRQFATLVGAGVALVSAMDIIIEQTDNSKLKTVLSGVAQDVHRGASLSEAMNLYPKVFNSLMIHMLTAGETGGILETVLNQLANQYEKDYRLNAKLRSALIYPGVVLCVAVLAVAIILTFVMPIFTNLFTALHTPLPWPTKVVMEISNFIQSGIGLGIILSLVVGCVCGYKQACKRPAFCLWRDTWFLKFPVLGQIYKKIIITRFATTFAGLSSSGVPILTALTVVSKATGNLQAEKVLLEARGNVQKGRGLAEPLKKSRLFPPMVVNMIAVGEETGSLDYMLDKIATFYGNEVDDMMGRLQVLLEPFLIVIMGFVVGFIAIAMLLPMFDIVTKVGNL
ncbi:MAG: type II secretion system F family protein [Acidaminococcaceae bacterium]|nr:type II secretion system F family protein [Acidaminococcaceae bacterium]